MTVALALASTPSESHKEFSWSPLTHPAHSTGMRIELCDIDCHIRPGCPDCDYWTKQDQTAVAQAEHDCVHERLWEHIRYGHSDFKRPAG